MRFEKSPNPKYPVLIIFDGEHESAAVSAAYREDLEETTRRGNAGSKFDEKMATWDGKGQLQSPFSNHKRLGETLTKYYENTDQAIYEMTCNSHYAYPDPDVGNRYLLGAVAARMAFYLPTEFTIAAECAQIDGEQAFLQQDQ